MKTVKVSAQYEMFKAESHSPANGLYIVVRLSDHAVSNWFDNDLGDILMKLDDNVFNLECSKLTF